MSPNPLPGPIDPGEKKRKRDSEKEQSHKKTKKIEKTKAPAANPKNSKEIRKHERSKPTPPNPDTSIDESIGRMDGRLLADFFAQRAKSKNSELTALELTELYIPEQAFLDTSAWDTERTLDNLPAFLEHHVDGNQDSLSKSSSNPGSPHTLVITLAGLRAADISRALRRYQTKESAVAKLFAKHIKLKQAAEDTKKTRMGIGIGTPVRLSDLVEAGALRLGSLQRIVIDGSYIDQKKRGIFDMKDILTPLLGFLSDAELKQRYGAKMDKVELLVY